MEQRLQALEGQIAMLKESQMTLPEPALGMDMPLSRQYAAEAGQDRFTEPVHQQTWKVVVDSNSGPNAVPASCVSEISTSSSPYRTSVPSQMDTDLVARGLLHIQTATKLFNLYQNRLNHFLYSIIGAESQLSTVRKSSSLLTSGIIAVAALHSRADDYQTCRQEFLQQIPTQVFSKQHNSDDIRGLCIGAFWLSDMSWPLVGAGTLTLLKIVWRLC